MRSNPYQADIEDEILTADPVKLVQMLYRGALEAVADARAKLAIGDIKARSAAVTRAVEILGELASSLNHERGGDLSASLAALYDFIQRHLLAGNQKQADEPLADAERVLQTLGEAWMGLDVPPWDASAKRSRLAAQPGYVPVSCAY